MVLVYLVSAITPDPGFPFLQMDSESWGYELSTLQPLTNIELQKQQLLNSAAEKLFNKGSLEGREANIDGMCPYINTLY